MVSNNGSLTAQTIKNVTYGNDPLQKMDVYLPAGRNTLHTKALILIHGGGAWTSGDKADFDTAIQTLQNSLPNFVLCNINYRTATIQGANVWPAQLSDINSAFQFIQQQQVKYIINAGKSAIFGARAGAQLALLLGYTVPNKIKAVVDLFGLTDLAGLYYNTPYPTYPALLPIFMSGTPATNIPGHISSNPLYLVITANLPSTIIFHGTADDVIPISQSDSLNNRLIQYNITHQYNQYAGAGHGWTGVNLIDTYNKSIQFLQQIMPD